MEVINRSLVPHLQASRSIIKGKEVFLGYEEFMYLLKERAICMNRQLVEPDMNWTEPGVTHCNSTWDSFLCWSAARAGDLMTQRCPKLLILEPSYNATKQCLANGSWERSNYSQCFLQDMGPHVLDEFKWSEISQGVNIVYSVGYGITIAALVLALAIFTYFRSLRCLRNVIHCNLIGAFLLNAIFWLLLKNTISNLMESSPISCMIIVILANHFHSVAFYWMFIEGLYLFTIIVWAFSASKIRLWHYLLIGWILPIIPSLIWVVLKLHFLGGRADIFHIGCLLSKTITYDYIVHGPVFAMLGANFFFVTSIIWVLVTKLKASNTLETRQSRKAVKATVVLFPLLGITYILFLEPPVKGTGLGLTFKYLNAVLQSCQGTFVAIIYCFLNGEVQSLLRHKFHALQDSRTLSRYTKSSFFGSPRRSSLYTLATTTNGKGATASVAGGGSTATDANRRQGDADEEVTTLVHSVEGGKTMRSWDTETEV